MRSGVWALGKVLILALSPREGETFDCLLSLIIIKVRTNGTYLAIETIPEEVREKEIGT